MRKFKMFTDLISVLLILLSAGSPVFAEAAIKSGNIEYRTQIENVEWQDWKGEDEQSGTSGKGLRLEGIEIKVTNLPDKTDQVGVTYQTHVQNIGWQEWVSDGTLSGTEGQGLRLEAIRIKLTGEDAEKYDVYYRVHAQNVGWMGWAQDGDEAGTAGYGYRLEAIQIQLKLKTESSPVNVSKKAFIEFESNTDQSLPDNNGENDLGATDGSLTDDWQDYADGISN